MDEILARKLQQVGEHFKIPGPFFNFEEISTGNVNHTYKADYIRDDGTGMARIKSYLVQRVNTYAFRDPIALMDNIDKVTEYIHAQRPNQTCLHYHHTTDRKTYVFDGDEFWRVCNYVPSVTYDTSDNLKIVHNAAEAFGDFQMILAGFDARELSYTIPDFHNTRKRYATLIKDAAEDPLDRVKNVREELDWLLSMQEKACLLTDMQDKGELPIRVTHNDTKINNVLFSPETDEALVVIDLDTVMPGLVGHDFGDAVRFAANFTEEDSENLSRTGLDLNIFWAFADGFLKKTAPVLEKNEVETLAHSAFVLACELATRFLDDYIQGDKYFKVKKDNHNVIRTRCQIALAKDMLSKLDAMDAIVRRCAEKYK
ncbi:MAG: aminoglycoside phosphotransferase family protein [Clostridia bacterium]|nr:aminoglycoside phosphotransferase family protein [Clostridia bacterium]